MSLQSVWDMFLGRTMCLQPVWDMFLGRTMCLQPVWDFVSGHSGLLASPFFPVLFSLSVYLLFCLPFVCVDLLSSRVGLIRRYKIQPNNSVSWDTMRSCLALSLYNHVVFIFPATVLHWCWRTPAAVAVFSSAPSLLSLLGGMLACLLLFDFQYFIWHVLHHKIPWLYRTFHKMHHTHTDTSALTAEYSGAWETLSLGFFAAVNPFLLGLHPLTELAFFVLNIWLSVEDHCGYDLPWATHRLVPWGLYGGAPHHHTHHLKFRSNYAPYFTHWDRLAGTLHHHDH